MRLGGAFCEDPSTLWLGLPWIRGGILSGALAAWLVAAGIGLSHGKPLVIAAGGLAGAIIGVFIGGQILTAKLRPYLRRVLEERQDEIARVE